MNLNWHYFPRTEVEVEAKILSRTPYDLVACIQGHMVYG